MFGKSLLSTLACVLAVGQLVTSAPLRDNDPGQSLGQDYAIEKRALSMDLWAGSVTGGSATWKKTLPNLFSDAATAKTAAKDGYDDVIKKTASSHKTDVQLVASLWIPSGPRKGTYLSSIPKSPTEALMTTAAAPAWAAAVHPRTSYHAEDGALWLFENSLKDKYKPGDKYPEGSIIFIYGHFKDSSGKAETAGYQNPCSQGSATPSCQTVLSKLGVSWGR